MKYIIFTILMLLTAELAEAQNAPKVIFHKQDGTIKEYPIDDIEEMVMTMNSDYTKLQIYSSVPEFNRSFMVKDYFLLKLNQGFLSIISSADTVNIPLMRIDSMRYYDNSDVESVTIGNQVWMKKNLNVNHYRNGDPIPEIKDPGEWANATSGAWCYLNNDSTNGEKFGKLYNFYAVSDPRGLAPEGWMVAGEDQWRELYSSAGANVSNLCDTITWQSVLPEIQNLIPKDSLGFSAPCSGLRYNYGDFYNLRSYYHTKKRLYEKEHTTACFDIPIASGTIMWEGQRWQAGMSVRCVKEAPVKLNIYRVEPLFALVGDTVSILGEGFGATQGSSNIQVAINDININNVLIWSDNHIRFIVPPNAKSGKIWIQDSQTYKFLEFSVISHKIESVKIGNQIWATKNCDFTESSDGNNILQIRDSTQWESLPDGYMYPNSVSAWCYVNFDSTTKAKYGLLYNYAAANQSIAPHGWRVANENDIRILAENLGGYSVAGEKMKSTNPSDWQSPNIATNESGFSAIQSGGISSEGQNGPVLIDNTKQRYDEARWWCSDTGSVVYVLQNETKELNIFKYSEDSVNTGLPIRLIRED